MCVPLQVAMNVARDIQYEEKNIRFDPATLFMKGLEGSDTGECIHSYIHSYIHTYIHRYIITRYYHEQISIQTVNTNIFFIVIK